MKAATHPPLTSKTTVPVLNQVRFATHSPTPTNALPPKPKPKDKKAKRSQADKRIDFLLKTKFDDDPDFRPLVVELSELDPTPKKKYLAWLVKHWLGDWEATEDDKRHVTDHLTTHHRGAKYFSPLSWTGLRLEDAGYHADIFRYTPLTIRGISGRIAEIIRIDEEAPEHSEAGGIAGTKRHLRDTVASELFQTVHQTFCEVDRFAGNLRNGTRVSRQNPILLYGDNRREKANRKRQTRTTNL